MLAKCAHGRREVNEVSLARYDDLYVWMRTLLCQTPSANGRRDNEGLNRAGIEYAIVTQIESRCAGDENILLRGASEFVAQAAECRILNGVDWATIS